MAENGVNEIANQLETLTAQSPAPQDASHLSASQSRETDSTESDLTDIDESLLQDDVPMSQSVSTGSHFINPTAPKVSYQVSASGEVLIMEEPKTPIQKTAPSPVPRSSPPPVFLSFERFYQGLPANTASSPPTTTIQPPSLAVERIMGPKQPIPARMLELLEEWHEDYPDSEHPSALTGRAPSTWKNFKAFTDDGDECELSIFQISLKTQTRRTVTYRILILHSQNGPEELIVYGQPRPKFRGPLSRGTKGMYLLDWLETETKGEVQACGLKLWRTDDKKITFTPQMFDDGRKCTRIPGVSDIFNTRVSYTTPKKQSNTNDDNEDAGSNSSDPLFLSFLKSKHQPSTPSYFRAEIENANKPPILSRLLRDDRKRRRSTLSSNDDVSIPIRYKLMSDVSEQVRVFKTDDAKVLFQKAQEFYNGIGNRTGLLCTFSGIGGVRYVGEGCVDEFDILQEDIRNSSSPGDKDPGVEVKPAMGF
ncbi:hypothetical protein PCG10_005213 [Penicillium crustosum]|uniref:Uncharacterized protein n=1 Tax=Penicillium crustosum TaxID=36656 RepID=A0A9P5GN53_PENCR|nr:hypothetical protein PCG10_005213 [Penicillium crustosum]